LDWPIVFKLCQVSERLYSEQAIRLAARREKALRQFFERPLVESSGEAH
jgi:hypothetical protein